MNKQYVLFMTAAPALLVATVRFIVFFCAKVYDAIIRTVRDEGCDHKCDIKRIHADGLWPSAHHDRITENQHHNRTDATA